jgi:6-phosphogluconate dehydrogenase
MDLGMIGLGRMGANMTRRLLRGGHRVVAFDLSGEAVATIEKEGATGIRDLADLPKRLETPRAVWIMVPSGDATESTVEQLTEVLERGDLVIDGGNFWYQDSCGERTPARSRHRFPGRRGQRGVGPRQRLLAMVGGAPEDVAACARVRDLAPAPTGWGLVGPGGARHFAKMVHNRIEYAHAAYAEGSRSSGPRDTPRI